MLDRHTGRTTGGTAGLDAKVQGAHYAENKR